MPRSKWGVSVTVLAALLVAPIATLKGQCKQLPRVKADAIEIARTPSVWLHTEVNLSLLRTLFTPPKMAQQ
eukprot:1142609-Pelagomonas_calceolata.AAC.9